MKPSDAAGLLPSLPPGAEILILRLRSLGDVVLTTPALAALHAWRPDLRLTILVQPDFAPVLHGNPAVAELLRQGNFLPTARELRRRRFRIVYNQHGGPTSALLAAASGAPVRVGWEGLQFASLYNVQVPGPMVFFDRQVVHSVEHKMTQFYYTGLPRGPIPSSRVFPRADAAIEVRQTLAEQGIAPQQPYAVLHPGAAFFTRRWDVDKFAALAQWLRHNQGVAPVVILGPGDRTIAEGVSQQLGPHGVIFQTLSLDKLIALVSGARLFIGHDTGPSHIAAAAGCPVVMIFGSSSSIRWRPWRVTHRVVQNDFPCNPCRGDRCYAFDEPRCILSVALEQVQDACRDLLAAQGSSTGLVPGPEARPATNR